MIENIKSILIGLAEEICSHKEGMSYDDLHAKIQQLHEISTVYHFLSKQELKPSERKQQEAQLDKILDRLQVKEVAGNTLLNVTGNDNFEVPTVMESIKDLVTEIPETDDRKTVLGTIDEPPTFVKKEKQHQSHDPKIVKDKKYVNDLFVNGLHVGLNDRMAFVTQLFDNNSSDYQRVISQVTTFSSFREVVDFIENIIKPEYNQWVGKEIFEERFLKILENYFDATS